MIYDNELVRYKSTQGLQTFAATSSKKQQQQFQRMLQQGKFCGNSVHGVQYLWATDTRRSVRIFWVLTVVAAIVSCIVMYRMLSSRHTEQKIKTVVVTSQLPIYTVNFPAVAICPWNHINWIRLKAAEERFLPQHPDKELRQFFYDLLLSLEGMTLTRLEPLEVYAKNKTVPRPIDDINIFELISFMSFRCDELFVFCAFDETPHDCCKIFVAERTEKGSCMVFNSLISEESRQKKLTDAYYPWKFRTSGEGTGLVFTLRYNKTYQRSDNDLPFAMNIIIKESDEWSDPLSYHLLPNTHNYMALRPIITETSTNTRSMPPQKRRCLFPKENSDKYERIDRLPFNKLNCYVKCQQRDVIKICNCTLRMFFPKVGNIRECKVSDLSCVYKNRDILSYIKHPSQDEYIKDTRRGVICDCIDSCLSMIFLSTLNTNLIPNANASVPIIKGDIYIGHSVITKYGARLQYTSLDLVANFGGILGLCLGASILSLAEALYGTIKIIAVLIVTKTIKCRKIYPMNIVNNFKK